MKHKTSKKAQRETLSQLGRKGGKAVVKKYGKGYMQKLAKKAAKARWGTKAK